ncbi:MAG TPA: dihydroxy-acid dehydratase, partial [Gaiellaceae bacterium]
MSVYNGSDPAKRHSAALTDGVDRAPARAMLKGVGFTDADLAKPLVGVATTWIETMPCNLNQRLLAGYVKQGIRAAGGTPVEFNTISVSDGVSMGTTGMRASLVSREVIADSIELVARGHLFDGLVCLVGCDKTIPAAVMALARLDLPGLVLYGGSIAPGRFRGRDVTVQDVFEAVGAHAAGSMSDGEVHALESVACPGAGACGGQFTANTMATALDFLGVSLRGLNEIPATHPGKPQAALKVGELVMHLVRSDTRPSHVLTRESIENAIAAIAATGGSTNGVLHLLAIAHEAGIDLTIDDFDTIASRTPIVADIKPGGRFVATDLFRAGGTALVARELVHAGLVHEQARGVDGRSLREVADAAFERPGQEVVVPWDKPLKPTGGLA